VVLLVQEEEAGRPSIFWVRRGARLSFGGGMYAFPGGKLDEEDSRIPVAGAEGLDAALRVCATRELFEEAGILLADGAGRLPIEERADLRRRLLAGDLAFGALLESRGLSLRSSDLRPAGRWITPPFLSTRFDARFFLAEPPAGQEATVIAGEASEGSFVRPEFALQRWREGRALLHPPNLNALQALLLDGPARRDRLLHPPLVDGFIAQRIEYQEGIVLVPLRTPTLPPATHTNCYLIGRTEVVLVDPGSADSDQQRVLLRVCEALRAEGRRPTAVLLTHHHRDHTGGAAAIAKTLAVPVWAHARTADRFNTETGLRCGRLLNDREELNLAGFPLQAIYTPGHAQGHLCLWHPPSGAVIAGDMVSGVSTIVIDPPEGELTSYLASLQRLIDLPCTTLYPAHGPPLSDGPEKLREYLAHRLERERQIVAAVGRGLGQPKEIVPAVYTDTPPMLYPVAERQVQAHLDKLCAEGRAVVRSKRYTLNPSPVVDA
jgi:ribonuclease/clavin/mitogillin